MTRTLSSVLLFLTALPGIVRAEKTIIHTAEKPLPPEEAAATMEVPEGFQVTLFAGEPDLKQPIGFCIDDRGRIWVAEAFQYPNHTDQPAADRIVIFEDTDNDGRHDKRTVFYEGLNYVTGIEVGFGGAWVMSPPYFYFIPDRDGDDVPDGKPEVVLDGFGNHSNAHNLANGFAWGPDGWLYGTHGRTNWSMIGKPGTPEEERARFDGGVWRYHPVRKVWEPFADGTTNPWGIDWDDYGQGFVTNCVNPHLFHVIQGAHYEPWRGRKSSEFAYQRIDTIADHRHFVGGDDIRSGLGSDAEDIAGGGHAHCGTMVYLGDNWPKEYRNGIFMNNIHGRRINHDIPKPLGSGYTASHGSDLMRSQDPWYMGVTLRYGPDGGVFISDWSDTGECHSYQNTQRETGRLFKITYGQPKKPDYDLATMNPWELAQLQLHRNDWWVRHARRELQERAAAGEDLGKARAVLLRVLTEGTHSIPQRLRALWALHVIGGIDEDFLREQLANPNEHLRAWSVRLLCETPPPNGKTLEQFALMARHDSSPVVRLELACALQRLSLDAAWPIAEALSQRAEDINDQNLPLMVWYGVEPLVHDDPDRFLALAENSRIPLLRTHAAHRIASLTGEAQQHGIEGIVRLLGEHDDPEFRNDLFAGLFDGFAGRRTVPAPANWSQTYAALQAGGELPEAAVRLALLFDDPAALADIEKIAGDPSADPARRQTALKALIDRRPEKLEPLLFSLLADETMAPLAIRGLAEYDAPDTAGEILERFSTLSTEARQDALQTLASRPAWATALLDAVDSGEVERRAITAFTVRQMSTLKDPALQKRIEANWGGQRPTSGEKAKLLDKLRKELTPETLAAADPSQGRAIFQRTCFACHRLYDEGGSIGPDLTGSQRQNLDYLLENIIDPSLVVSKDFRLNTLTTANGRTVGGFIVSENENAITVQSLNEQIVIPATEVVKREEMKTSMMPEGLLLTLTDEEVRDLIAYLSGTQQAPLPPPVH
ncbi:MAG: c-type cytochrome [Verrucomicrobiae bacterium]|nr:c-type cytochrome [Verrucomicrobiae bacterium]